jgi:hypothetical protein
MDKVSPGKYCHEPNADQSEESVAGRLERRSK